MLIDLKPRIRQPRTRAVIDWSHPFARALRFAYTVDAARPYMDLVRGRNGTPISSSVNVVMTPYGTGLGLGGANDYLNFGNGGIPNAGGSITIFARIKAKLAAGSGIFGISSGGGNPGAFSWYLNVTGTFTLQLPGVANINSSPLVATNGHLTDVGIAFTSGVGVRFFTRDLSTGIIQFQTIAGAFTPIFSATTSTIGGSPSLNSPILLTYFWDRVLTDQELLAMSFEPYAFVAPVRPVRTLVKYPWNHSWGTVPRLVLSSSDRLFQVPAHPQQGRGY